jgi:hypothetical protein
MLPYTATREVFFPFSALLVVANQPSLEFSLALKLQLQAMQQLMAKILRIFVRTMN